MRINELESSENNIDVRITDFERFFDIYEDQKHDVYRFNLNSTIYLESVPTKEYKLTHDQFWTQISYNIYNTTRLWWCLMKINDVKCENTFDIVPAGTSVKYIDMEIMENILLEL